MDVIYDNAMVNVGGLRLGPFGGACEDKAGWCRCNQGQHHVYGSKVLGNGGFAYYTDLDLTFATCGYQVQTTHDIVLGQTADFSGGVDGVGVAMRDGMRAAFEQANTVQVVGGAEVKLISRDDEGSPAVSVDNMRKLIQDDRVFAIVGSLGISTATATLPVALESGVPVIGLAVGSRSAHVPFSSTVINIRASEVAYLQSLHHFKFKFFGLDHDMALELVSGANSRCVLHHVSSPTRWNGSRGQVWPRNDRKTT